MTLRHVVTRTATCTLATTVIALAAAPGAASAATAKRELLYNTTTSTGVVQLVLALPSTVPALPGVPNPVVITLLGTDAQGHHGATGADVATAHSYLAGGSLVTDSALSAVLGPLNRTVTASLSDPGDKSEGLITAPSNPLGLGLGVVTQKAGVSAATRAATSSSTLADASLGSLRSLGLGTVLEPALAQLNAALATVTDQASPLTGAISGLPALPVISVPNPLSGVVTGVPATISTPALSGATLSSTVNELPAQIEALTDKLLDGDVVKLNAVSTKQALTPAATSVTAAGDAGVASVDLFGGLVQVTASQAKVSAKAGLTKSAASSTAAATLVSVKVSDDFGDLLQLVASEKGLTAGLLDGTLGQTLSPTVEAVVATVDAALDTVLEELTGLLSSLNAGASAIKQGTTSKTVSADGHSAEAHAVPAEVVLGLPVAPDLLTLSIGKADAVAGLSVASAVVAAPDAPAEELPHTGLADQAGLLALGVIVVGAATAAYRRRALR